MERYHTFFFKWSLVDWGTRKVRGASLQCERLNQCESCERGQRVGRQRHNGVNEARQVCAHTSLRVAVDTPTASVMEKSSRKQKFHSICDLTLGLSTFSLSCSFVVNTFFEYNIYVIKANWIRVCIGFCTRLRILEMFHRGHVFFIEFLDKRVSELMLILVHLVDNSPIRPEQNDVSRKYFTPDTAKEDRYMTGD